MGGNRKEEGKSVGGGLKNPLKEIGLSSEGCVTLVMSFKGKGKGSDFHFFNTVLAPGEVNFVVMSGEKGIRTRLNPGIK